VIRSSSITGNAAPGGIGAGILNHGAMTIAGSEIASAVRGAAARALRISCPALGRSGGTRAPGTAV
jgi:hypothetical protein